MKKLLLAVGMFVLSVSCAAWETKEAPETNPAQILELRFDGDATDIDMVKTVRNAVETVKRDKKSTLKITIASGGGPVITMLEVARILRKASDSGVVVEIHAEMVCASGCTMVLASGTPGHRFIQKGALFLVHPVQAGMGGCKDRVEKPVTQDDKALNALYDFIRDSYVKYTKQPVKTVEGWLVCGQEHVGGGALAVEMKIADKVEE